MTNRERWIVYPVMFFSLAVALRANLLMQQVGEAQQRVAQTLTEGQLSTGQLVCDSIFVRHVLQLGDGQSDPLLVIGKLESGRGAMWLNNPQGQRTVTMTTDDEGNGALQFDSAERNDRVILGTSGLDIFGADHKPLAVIGRRSDGSGGVGIFFNGQGQQQLQLDGGGDAGRVTAMNAAGDPMVSLTNRRGEAGAVVVFAKDQHPLVNLGGNSNDTAGVVEVFGTERTPQVRVTSAESGGVVATFDARGAVLTSLQHDGTGGGLIRVGSSDGNTIVALGAERREKAGMLQVFDPKGRPMVTMTSEQGGGTIETRNVRGSRLVGLDHTVTGEGVVSMYDARGNRFVAAPVNPAGMIQQEQPAAAAGEPSPEAAPSEPAAPESPAELPLEPAANSEAATVEPADGTE